MNNKKKDVFSYFILVASLMLLVFVVFAYFFMKLPLKIFIPSLLLLLSGILLPLVSLQSTRNKLQLEPENLEKKQSVLAFVGSALFGLCSLWLFVVEKVGLFYKSLFLIGFMYFFVAAIMFLVKGKRK